jgi:membrane-associated phospholipid phosphatase
VRPRPSGATGSPVLLAAALAVFALVTADVVASGPLTRLDHLVSDWARSTGIPGPGWRRPGQREADAIVNFGDRDVVGPITLLVVGYLSVRARTVVPVLRLVGLALLAGGIVLALKYGIGRHAPSGVHGPEALRSYPSGHTTAAVVLWGGLYTAAADHPDYGVSPAGARLLAWFAPLLVMVGMVVRDYHWVTDLVGAAALCTALLQAERLALGHWLRARRGAGGPSAGGAGGAAAVRAGPGPG